MKKGIQDITLLITIGLFIIIAAILLTIVAPHLQSILSDIGSMFQ